MAEAATQRYRCIICGFEAEKQPPRRCPRCGTPAARFRLMVPPVTAIHARPVAVAQAANGAAAQNGTASAATPAAPETTGTAPS
jgi:DNA-directed RNA polymerase subunit RPC12/RpoP